MPKFIEIAELYKYLVKLTQQEFDLWTEDENSLSDLDLKTIKNKHSRYKQKIRNWYNTEKKVLENNN